MTAYFEYTSEGGSESSERLGLRSATSRIRSSPSLHSLPVDKLLCVESEGEKVPVLNHAEAPRIANRLVIQFILGL